MCLITVCPKGTLKDSETLYNALKTAGLTNIDGAGFTFKRNSTKKVFISKGYKTTTDLLEAIKKHKLSLNDELVIHQRIGNKGAVNTDMCHPFVVSEFKDEILLNNKYVSKPTMVHNGTFPYYSVQGSLFSDTFNFINKLMYQKDLLSMLKTDLNFFKDLLSLKLGSNRLCFLFPNEDIDLITLGEYKIHEEGYLFSNESYKDKTIINIGGVETKVQKDLFEDESDYSNVQGMRNFNKSFLKDDISYNTDKKYRYPRTINDEIIVSSGVSINEEVTGIIFREYKGLWVPEKHNTDNQFNSIKFSPNIFNYMDFNLVARNNDYDLKINKGRLYKIVKFNRGDNSVYIKSAFSDTADFIYLDIYRLLSLFKTVIVKADLIAKYQGFYNLVRDVNFSKNILKQINKKINSDNFLKPNSNTIFKHCNYKTPAALLLFQNVMTKELFPNTFMEEISKKDFAVIE